ncbi:nicotinamidase-related amidase [Angulomicrobium tetraedrale]|uniref:Nicotinamidase-related amidase n=1 Tax=Ancylobacter tetraedralis TaxID=217068 RepID=A0A839Z868_9HYPH|nr:isochorismatase family cysteine hydrolase [Ancylobacter tetraedralis]MBB3770355.1 nicotinamidase-related amidase [Ancylobacter tetraedralis]
MTPATTALILIDLQNEYRPGATWAIIGYDSVLANAAQLLATARKAGICVVHAQFYVRDEERGDYALHDEAAGETFRSAVAGEPGAEICAEVAPQDGDIVLHKNWPSAFRHTDLEARLKARGIETLVVAGVLTDSCVTATVFDAVYLGFHVFLVKEACGSLSEAMHRTGMLDMANRLYGGGILRMPEVLKALEGKAFRGWLCTRPVEFAYSLDNVNALYDSL